MKFLRIKGVDEAARILSTRLREELGAHKRVLWLVPGGSNLAVAVQAMDLISRQETKHLTLMLTDERYGPIDHADSNLFQLNQAGMIPKDATVVPVLANVSLEDTIKYYAEAAQRAFEVCDVVIGQFGIGDDGHIAGILPHSEAAVLNDAWVFGYAAPDYTRLTLSPHAISKVTAAYAFVFGENKKTMLESLRDKNLPLEDQPSRILKMVKEAYVYSDQIGE
jgi:6-phosphogluconolactonase/glucosamine-6-phosphate isomerase/deaminase